MTVKKKVCLLSFYTVLSFLMVQIIQLGLSNKNALSINDQLGKCPLTLHFPAESSEPCLANFVNRI
jgi:hypothetical protein